MEEIASIAKALLNLDVNDRLMKEKAAALVQLGALIQAYQKEYFHEKLVQAIREKKIEHICSATTKADLDEIMSAPKIRYDYNKIYPVGNYHIPEEELIYWSLTSLKAPLVQHGFERYLEVFEQVFPGINLN